MPRGDEWTINEIVFFNLAPNFIGGYEGRMAYLNGERCFNDHHMIAAFQALEDLSPFLPPNHTLLKYIGQSLYFHPRPCCNVDGRLLGYPLY